MNEQETSNPITVEETPANTNAEKIDPGHEKSRSTLRKAGIICLVAALPLMCIPFIGFPLMFVGLVLTLFGYAGKMARYQAAEIAPVQKDTFNYLANGTQQGVKTATHAAGEGLAAGLTAGGLNTGSSEIKPGIRCHKCNFIETADAKFCSKCGASMEKSKPCPDCKELNDPDAKFCDNCGKEL